jgi:hypothetical protein
MALIGAGARMDVADAAGATPAALCAPSQLAGFRAAEKSAQGRRAPPGISDALARECSLGACHAGENDPRWVRDADSDGCLLCGTGFSLTRRRHHCKSCGLLVCYYCCAREFPLALGGVRERGCPPHGGGGASRTEQARARARAASGRVPAARGAPSVAEVKATKVCDGCFNRLCASASRLADAVEERERASAEERRANAHRAAVAKARANLGLAEGARADDVEVAGKRTRHAAAKASAGDVGSSLARARDAADRRGRALNELGDKSAQMAHAAGDFNAMCKALAAKQDKKIFGIF